MSVMLSKVLSALYMFLVVALQVGVRNGMMMGHARQLCPDLIVIPYDFNQYRAVSKLFYETVAR